MVEAVTPETAAQRRDAEIKLLRAMYPDQIFWHANREELTYTTESSANLVLRLSEEYPTKLEFFIVVAADDVKEDVRAPLQCKIDSLKLSPDVEILDTIISAFDGLLEQRRQTAQAAHAVEVVVDHEMIYKTVVIWLHHLLNTNKRKLAINPTNSMSKVNGLTKPGYPGILLFSGHSVAVDEHVAELKSQRWQAFSVRYDEVVPDTWTFTHKRGIREVETMSELTEAIRDPHNRDDFLTSIRIK